MKRVALIIGATVFAIAITTSVNASAEPAAATPTFNEHVAPILFDNCVSCHRADQIAPMVLTSYQDARPWARAIKDKVVQREMPPWHADPRFGSFVNDRRLTQEQIDIIAAWADGGAPEGDTPLTVELPVFDDGWVHPSGRPPDFILAMDEPFDVPAQGELPNFTIYQELPQELQEKQRFVEAIQMLPGVIQVVHHASFGIRPLQAGTMVGTGELFPGGPVVDGVLFRHRLAGRFYAASRRGRVAPGRGFDSLHPLFVRARGGEAHNSSRADEALRDAVAFVPGDANETSKRECSPR